MTTYSTIESIPDLSLSLKNSARGLTFSKDPNDGDEWDNYAYYSGSLSTDWIYSTFRFMAKVGATYKFSSSSYFDPHHIRVYDFAGNAIAVNQPDTTDGQDFLLDFVPPYSGPFYVDAGWNKGNETVNKEVALIIREDVDTMYVVNIPGTITNDILTGFFGTESINGLGGNDILNGLLGSDILDGGDGIDV